MVVAMRLRRLLPAVVLMPLALAAASARAATTSTTSTNWAGYAVTRSGVAFDRVAGRWTVPAVSCAAGAATDSANWIGIGGLDESSTGLEQLGTESDCTSRGRATYSAWFEVLPAASSTARMKVRAGDRMAASVTISGRRVRLRLTDLTRGTSEQRTVRASVVDRSSAEWIVEAPSLCAGSDVTSSACRQTEIADFGTTGFSGARATTAGGHSGGIADAAWSALAITLRSGVGGVGPGGPWRGAVADTAGAAATPQALATATSFSVVYDAGAATGSQQALSRSAQTAQLRLAR